MGRHLDRRPGELFCRTPCVFVFGVGTVTGVENNLNLPDAVLRRVSRVVNRPGALTVSGMVAKNSSQEKKEAGRALVFSPEEVSKARSNIKRAFELSGLVSNGHPVCPQCGKTGNKRVKLFSDGGYKCYSAGACVGRKGGAVDLVMDRANVSFIEAVGAILGRTALRNAPRDVRISVDAGDSFTAVADTEVFDALCALGDVEAAVAYYGQWHIAPEAVRESKSVVVDAAQVRQVLTDRFGRERLVAAGLVVPREGKSDFWVVNERYPAIEPHLSAEGHCVGLQTRPSDQQYARYQKHTEYARQRREAVARGEDFRPPGPDERYVPKFLSLRGGQVGVHLVGCGLHRLASLGDGATVYIVEGFKDMLAMRTLGFEAYALPGAGIAPPPAVIAELSRFRLAIAFDADEGGDLGSVRLGATLAANGIVPDAMLDQWRVEYPHTNTLWSVRYGLESIGLTDERLKRAGTTAKRRMAAGWGCWRKRPPEGFDVADVVVSRKAEAGCTCSTCVSFRNR